MNQAILSQRSEFEMQDLSIPFFCLIIGNLHTSSVPQRDRSSRRQIKDCMAFSLATTDRCCSFGSLFLSACELGGVGECLSDVNEQQTLPLTGVHE